MKNNSIQLVSWGLFIGLSFKLWLTANEHSLWREFWVSEFVLVVTVIAVPYLLRPKVTSSSVKNDQLK